MEQIPIHQIIQSFESKISEKEQVELDKWLSESVINRQRFEELRKTYTISGKLKIDLATDEIKALEKVHQQINSRKNIRMVWRAAAAIIILVLATQIILQTKSTVNWQEISASQNRTIYLPDSSKVILAVNARLKFPETFSGIEREVKLTGKAYFEITKNPEKPFLIKTKNTNIEVLGTKFLVDASQPNTEKVIVDEGKVALKTGVFMTKKVLLTQNEIGVWNRANNELSKQITHKQNSNTWLSGRFKFSNLPLSDVLNTLENHFNIKIALADENFNDIKYSGQFNTSDAEEIIETICITLNLSYQKEGNNFEVKP
jgi:ferric-dicitrate binding protein FerR (iron transport regulator)